MKNLLFGIILFCGIGLPSARAQMLAAAQTGFVQHQWSVGYYNHLNAGWGSLPPSDVEWAGLTHVIFWGGLVNADGTLDLTTEEITTYGPTLIASAHAHGVKALLGLMQQDWLGAPHDTTIPDAITNHLSLLVTNVMSAVNSYGFDGVDVNWDNFDPTNSGYAANMNSLSSALRTALGTRPLTTAVNIPQYTWWGTHHSNFDRVQLMSYDQGGMWLGETYYNSPLWSLTDSWWSADLAVRRFTAAGVPASKLSIGIPFYGWQYVGGGMINPYQTWSTTPAHNQIYYQGLASIIAGGTYSFDSTTQVPYISTNTGNTSTDSFLTYDNAQSITAKVNYAKSRGLGGWIIWELVGDYFPSQTPNQPFLDAIRTAR